LEGLAEEHRDKLRVAAFPVFLRTPKAKPWGEFLKGLGIGYGREPKAEEVSRRMPMAEVYAFADKVLAKVQPRSGERST
jgi:hypothetical protein